MKNKAAAKRELIRTLELHAAVLDTGPGAVDRPDYAERACIHIGRAHYRIWTTAAAHERMAKNFKRLKLASLEPWEYHEKACGR